VRQLTDLVSEWTAGGVAGELVLAHVGEIARDDDVMILCSEKLTKSAEIDASKLGGRFGRAARADAETRSGPQRYRLSFFVARRKAPADTHAFTIHSGLEDQPDGTLKSQVRESCKQNRRLHELMVRMSEGTAGAFGKMHHETLEEVRQLRSLVSTQYISMAKSVADLTDRKHERDLETASAVRSEERKDWVWQMLQHAVPVLLASASGSTVVAKLLRGLDEEKRLALLAMLDEEQTKLLFDAVGQDDQARSGVEAISTGLTKQLPASGGNGVVESES